MSPSLPRGPKFGGNFVISGAGCAGVEARDLGIHLYGTKIELGK